MNNLFLSISIILLFAFTKNQSGCREKDVSYPSLVEMTKVMAEFPKNHVILNEYNLNKKNDNYVIHECSFSITADGKFIPEKYTKDRLINTFLNEFKKYKWKPAVAHNGKRKFVEGYGLMRIYIVPQEHYVRFLLEVTNHSVNDERIKVLFNKKFFIEK